MDGTLAHATSGLGLSMSLIWPHWAGEGTGAQKGEVTGQAQLAGHTY